MRLSDRYPSPPIIESGYPKNITVLENSTAIFECPVLGDLAVHILWARVRNFDSNITIENLEVFEIVLDFIYFIRKSFEVEAHYHLYSTNLQFIDFDINENFMLFVNLFTVNF